MRQEYYLGSGGSSDTSSRALPPVVSGSASFRRAAGAAAKIVLDIVGAAMLLIALSPILLAVAIAIKVDSPGPVFYRCSRIGYRGRSLAMLKFRKMHDDVSGPGLTLAEDDRFTRVGSLIARLKLDELPQLWNVLKGEMSLVGPRPESAEFVELHHERYETILRVRPGITGLCQLAFAKEGAILDPGDRISDYTQRLLPQKVSVDEFYASSRSLRMDMSILLWTLLAVVARADVAVNRATGALTRRRRPVAAPADALVSNAEAT